MRSTRNQSWRTVGRCCSRSGHALTACRAGITVLHDTLPENRRVRNVLRRAGFQLVTRPADGLVRVSFSAG